MLQVPLWCQIVELAQLSAMPGTSEMGQQVPELLPATNTQLQVLIVILTITDSNGNIAYASVTIIVGEPGAPYEITVTATPTEVDPGGGDSAITANVKDAEGNAVTNGTTVTFGTTSGSLLATSVTTSGGFATTTLTLSSEGSATVTAVCGSVSDTVIVTCPPVPTP